MSIGRSDQCPATRRGYDRNLQVLASTAQFDTNIRRKRYSSTFCLWKDLAADRASVLIEPYITTVFT
jgi:hypothetical protein